MRRPVKQARSQLLGEPLDAKTIADSTLTSGSAELSACLYFWMCTDAELCAAGGSYFLRAIDGAGKEFSCPEQGAAAPIKVSPSQKTAAPKFVHTPVLSARPGQSLRVTAGVRCELGLRSLVLRYRSVTQYQDYFHLEMQPTRQKDEFWAEIPGEHILSEWDFAYYFEILDNQGNGWIRPDQTIETPYIIVKLDRT